MQNNFCIANCCHSIAADNNREIQLSWKQKVDKFFSFEARANFTSSFLDKLNFLLVFWLFIVVVSDNLKLKSFDIILQRINARMICQFLSRTLWPRWHYASSCKLVCYKFKAYSEYLYCDAIYNHGRICATANLSLTNFQFIPCLK